jgi:hypothetical protein
MKFKELLVIFVGTHVISVNASESVTRRQLSCGNRPAGIGNVWGGINEIQLVAMARRSSFQANQCFLLWGELGNRSPCHFRSVFKTKIAFVISFGAISASHCFEEKHRREEDVKSAKDVIAWVGKHNLEQENERGSVAHDVKELIIHEDWKYDEDNFDADIALNATDSFSA